MHSSYNSQSDGQGQATNQATTYLPTCLSNYLTNQLTTHSIIKSDQTSPFCPFWTRMRPPLISSSAGKVENEVVYGRREGRKERKISAITIISMRNVWDTGGCEMRMKTKKKLPKPTHRQNLQSCPTTPHPSRAILSFLLYI